MSRRDVVYLVSRFPVTSETFIVREIEALDRSGKFHVEIRSLFPSPDEPVHDIARRWSRHLVRPTARDAATGLAWALLTRPIAVMSVLATVTPGYLRRPPLLVRALTTVPIACAHARDLARRGRPCHVHAHYATYPALAAWVCRRLAGISYSFTVHAHDLYVDMSMLDRKIADACYVVTISQYNRALLEQHNSMGTPIRVVHAGIDVGAYRFRARGVPAEGEVRALTVASLQQYKGHAVLLEALALGGPEVDQVDLFLGIAQQIGGFDIPVNHRGIQAMQVFEDVQHLPGYLNHGAFTGPPAIVEHGGQRDSRNFFDHQKEAGARFVFKIIDQAGNTCVVQVFQRLGLALEQLHALPIVEGLDLQFFDNHKFIAIDVNRAVGRVQGGGVEHRFNLVALIEFILGHQAHRGHPSNSKYWPVRVSSASKAMAKTEEALQSFSSRFSARPRSCSR